MQTHSRWRYLNGFIRMMEMSELWSREWYEQIFKAIIADCNFFPQKDRKNPLPYYDKLYRTDDCEERGNQI